MQQQSKNRWSGDSGSGNTEPLRTKEDRLRNHQRYLDRRTQPQAPRMATVKPDDMYFYCHGFGHHTHACELKKADLEESSPVLGPNAEVHNNNSDNGALAAKEVNFYRQRKRRSPEQDLEQPAKKPRAPEGGGERQQVLATVLGGGTRLKDATSDQQGVEDQLVEDAGNGNQPARGVVAVEQPVVTIRRVHFEDEQVFTRGVGETAPFKGEDPTTNDLTAEAKTSVTSCVRMEALPTEQVNAGCVRANGK
ncbi:hypothetical protein F444_14522 [Phytophthora nicotianae P1976]|uniref:Uncharacterized protein n=1 Tax=Phytophthora nicotianae P1976 TaxID=1317066 RepID=A0A080ZPX7_PHYNI|nr:hypothetical protein F444_14522 [Phytophthora nicotianae P1976]